MVPLLRAGLTRLPSGCLVRNAQGAFHAALYNSRAKKEKSLFLFLVLKEV